MLLFATKDLRLAPAATAFYVLLASVSWSEEQERFVHLRYPSGSSLHDQKKATTAPQGRLERRSRPEGRWVESPE